MTHINGLMYQISEAQGGPFEYLRFRLGDAATRARAYLDQAEQLDREGRLDAVRFDSIYLDEGQDFCPDEYRLLLALLRPDPGTGERNLVIFYDEAQNVYGHARPKWKDLGIDATRGPAPNWSCT